MHERSSFRKRKGRVLFISHGSPGYVMETNPAVQFWETLGRRMPPSLEAVIVISAHAQGRATLRGGGRRSTLLCDFSGFPLFDCKTWTLPVAYEQHAQIVSALEAVGLRVEPDPEGPLDHGVWVPLRAMWPAPVLPVFSLVLPEDPDLDHWWQMGERLAPCSIVRISGSAVAGSCTTS
ncbi:extradiol-type ring-opening dioxygenase [mine drainage metagenome]|uniref:Extradiol-type ring-opening dioxygenase n=1 Tax=mine drainage metagenome TaxID=410659 RepID=T1BF25_9ZZZZ